MARQSWYNSCRRRSKAAQNQGLRGCGMKRKINKDKLQKEYNKDKLQKEYIKQLTKQVNTYAGCQFDFKLMQECMYIAAFLAVEKLKGKK